MSRTLILRIEAKPRTCSAESNDGNTWANLRRRCLCHLSSARSRFNLVCSVFPLSDVSTITFPRVGPFTKRRRPTLSTYLQAQPARPRGDAADANTAFCTCNCCKTGCAGILCYHDRIHKAAASSVPEAVVEALRTTRRRGSPRAIAIALQLLPAEYFLPIVDVDVNFYLASIWWEAARNSRCVGFSYLPS